MAWTPLTSITYVGNGATTIYTFPFSYIYPSTIKVYVDALESTSWTFTGTNEITFGTAPAAGTSIVIKRETSLSSRYTDYQAGGILTEAALDNDSLQAFYLAQEERDRIEEVNEDLDQALLAAGQVPPVNSGDNHKFLRANYPAATATWETILASDIDGSTDVEALLNAADNAAIIQPLLKAILTNTGDILYRNSGGSVVRLAAGTNGQGLKLASGVPSWATDGKLLQTSYAFSNSYSTDSGYTAVSTSRSAVAMGVSVVSKAFTPLSTTSQLLIHYGVWNMTSNNTILTVGLVCPQLDATYFYQEQDFDSYYHSGSTWLRCSGNVCLVPSHAGLVSHAFDVRAEQRTSVSLYLNGLPSAEGKSGMNKSYIIIQEYEP